MSVCVRHPGQDGPSLRPCSRDRQDQAGSPGPPGHRSGAQVFRRLSPDRSADLEGRARAEGAAGQQRPRPGSCRRAGDPATKLALGGLREPRSSIPGGVPGGLRSPSAAAAQAQGFSHVRVPSRPAVFVWHTSQTHQAPPACPEQQVWEPSWRREPGRTSGCGHTWLQPLPGDHA